MWPNSKKRATTAQENLKKLSKFEKDTLISILYERNKEIDERKATKKIEDNLTNYLRGQMASGIRNVCDGYHDSFLSMAEKSFYEIKIPNYSGNKKNTNDDNDNDSSNSTSDKSVNNEDDKKDKDNYVIDENHAEKDDVLNEEYDTLDENEVNEFELPLKLKNYGVCSEENELDSSESLFESISNDICIDEEAVTKINPSNKNRPNEVTEAIKTLYEMVIQKFDLCDESMDETKKRLRTRYQHQNYIR
ncbi:hypothetical protein BDC45DRAFT_200075 [Circinella umbellata]|nr:hypothetical protein BDC45DRAFT_200075 [Circinella umbellata]